jgi:hypothetical protein
MQATDLRHANDLSNALIHAPERSILRQRNVLAVPL